MPTGRNAPRTALAGPRQRFGYVTRALLPALPATREPPLPELPPRLRAWAEEAAASVDRARLRALVAALPGPRSRLHAPAAMAAADALILDGFRAAGWSAERQPFTFTDAHGYRDYGDYGPVIYPRLEGANIIAVKPGRALAAPAHHHRRAGPAQSAGSVRSRRVPMCREGPVHAGAVAVIAHHDTVRDSPGADDNGAAVAVLVELARLLAPLRLHRTVVLAATDMEELGFFGARALGVQLWRERSLHGLFNLESVAYTAATPGSQVVPAGLDLLYPGQYRRVQARQRRGDFTALIYNGPATGLAAAFAAGLAHLAGTHVPLLLRSPLDLPWVGGLLPVVVPAILNFARSDHLPFWLARVPAVLVTDTANFRNPHYHRPTDTPDTLDYERLAALTAAAAVAVAWTAGLA